MSIEDKFRISNYHYPISVLILVLILIGNWRIETGNISIMNVFLLEGNQNDQKNYINAFVEKKSLKPYQVISFDSERIKIANIRDLKKIFTVKYEDTRVVVLSGDYTIEAQNALLKTLEELSENIFLFLCVTSLESIIPTVTSRVKLIKVGLQKEKRDEIFEQAFKQFLEEYKKGNNSSVFTFLDICNFSSQQEIDLFMDGLRSELLSSILASNTSFITRLLNILESILHKYPELKNNNINKRFFLENLLLMS